MKLLKSRFVVTFSLVAIVTLSVTSCKKNKECNGTIKVVDLATGDPVSNATVKLYIPSPNAGFVLCSEGFVETKDLTTSGSGQVQYCLDLPATVSIDVTSGSKTGTGVLACDVGESVETTISIQ